MFRPAGLLLCLTLALSAQQPEFWPGAQYDPAIPTTKQVLGYEVGERIAPPEDIVRYFDALAAAAPTRMRVKEYARSWEGRKLIYAVIASPENLAKLDSIQAGVQKLNDPRTTTPAEAKQLIASMPVVLDLSYGVHGNEISSPDAALMTAYHLLAARNDKLVDDFYKHVVLLMDPLQNPDGRNRFVQNFVGNMGLEPDPSPYSAERAEPWPMGRVNHYFFDMNRDWFALTQPETLGRVRYLREWWPQVMVDLHEMGTDSTYFFAPGSEPFNPHILKNQLEGSAMFGHNNAKWFDKFGYDYFTREVYDEFYPGYGAGWPWFYGAIGMTYENASVRGLVARRADGTLYVYRDSVRKHFITSVATCETATVHRAELLENFYNYHVTAIDEGRKEAVKQYVLPRRGDTSAVDKLAHVLAEQAIEVRQAKAAFTVAGKEYPVGSYLVELAQPHKRFVRVLLDRDVPLDKAFAAEQESRRKRHLPDQIYDVTGWSLPLLYNVECVGLAEVAKVASDVVTGPYAPQGTVSGKAAVAYLVPWGTQAAGRFLTAALRTGVKMLSVNKEFTMGGRKYPAGTLALLVKDNAANLFEQVTTLATKSGAEVVATDTSWTEGGINFGSSHTFKLKPPAIALLWDAPASSIAAGNLRYVIERQFGYPVTAVRTQAFSYADLSQFQVILLPGGGPFGAVVGGPNVERLRAWVRSGGTLIAMGSAMSALAQTAGGPLAVMQEAAVRDGAKPGEPAKPAAPLTGPVAGSNIAKPEDYEKAIVSEAPVPDGVAGVLAYAHTLPETWITAGLAPKLPVMVEGNLVFTPIRIDRGINAVSYAPADELVAAGYLWEENRKQLAYKPVVVVQPEGRGHFIGFATEPTFRGFMDGLNVLLLNAIFRAPAGGRGLGAAEL